MRRTARILTAAILVACALPAHATIGSWIEPNLGQTDPAVQAIARDGRLTMLLEPQRARALLPRTETIAVGEETIEKTSNLLLELVMLGADTEADMVMGEARGAASRYFRGNDPGAWLTHVGHHESVRFVDVYAGIDLVYRMHNARIEYDFEVEPGADLSKIRIGIHGADDVLIDDSGNLVAKTAAGEFKQRAPEVFRVVDSGLQPVAGAFELNGDIAGFRVDAAEQNSNLIIDPVIEFSGYLGGSLDDLGRDIDVNSRGNLIVSGTTSSIDIPGAPCCAIPNGQDIYFAEIDRSSGELIWIGFVGGSEADWVREHALDSQDNIVAVGFTDSSDFPTVNAFQSVFAGGQANDFGWDGIVLKLADDGSQIVFSTYYGGVDLDGFDASGYESLQGVAIDDSNHIHVVGHTGAPDFPVTTLFQGFACLQRDLNAGVFDVGDVVLIEFAPDGTRLFATCIGGASFDFGSDLALGPAGRIHIGGISFSDDLPTSANAFQPAPLVQDSLSAYVLKLDETGTDIEWGTYISGSGPDYLFKIAVGHDGSVVGGGYTHSADFPVTGNALQSVLNAGQDLPSNIFDGFVFKLSGDGTALEYATYFGGTGDDRLWTMRLDDAGRIYFAGGTDSHDLLVRNTLQPLPRPLFGSAVTVDTGDVINDIAVIDDFTPTVVTARNGVNQYTVQRSEDDFETFDFGVVEGTNSLDVVSGTFFFSSNDFVFINPFAPNTLYGHSNPGSGPILFFITEFQGTNRDARAATAVRRSSAFYDDIVVANFGQQNELFVIGDLGNPIPVGSPDGNTVAAVSGYFGGADTGEDGDLIFANYGQDIRLLRYAGNLAYADPVIISTQSPNVSSLALGDIDGDSDTDLVIGNNPGPVQVVRFEAFEPGTVEEIAGSAAATNAVLLSDGDRDGDLDLFVGNADADQLYLNDGSGNFTVADDFPGVATITRALAVADFCDRCQPYFAHNGTLGRYELSSPDIFVGVIDPLSGSLEFSSYLDGGASDYVVRGLRVLDGGTLLLHGITRGHTWPVVGAAQATPGGDEDAVFIEIDIDIDDDTIIDGSDNCLEVANPLQRDTDNDAFGNFCDPDLNNDGAVNFADLQLFKQRFFGDDPDADLNGDGTVNFADLQIAKTFIFGPPGPSGLLLP